MHETCGQLALCRADGIEGARVCWLCQELGRTGIWEGESEAKGGQHCLLRPSQIPDITGTRVWAPTARIRPFSHRGNGNMCVGICVEGTECMCVLWWIWVWAPLRGVVYGMSAWMLYELNVDDDNDGRFNLIWLYPHLCVCSRACAYECDVAQHGDSWWSRLPSSDSGNHFIPGIWLTDVNS